MITSVHFHLLRACKSIDLSSIKALSTLGFFTTYGYGCLAGDLYSIERTSRPSLVSFILNILINTVSHNIPFRNFSCSFAQICSFSPCLQGSLKNGNMGLVIGGKELTEWMFPAETLGSLPEFHLTRKAQLLKPNKT